MITAEQITDFLIDASFANYEWFEYSVIPSQDDQIGVIFELDECGNRIGHYPFTHKTVRRGLETVASGRGVTVEDVFECYDADDADVVMQMALFGEVRYA